MGRLGLFPRTCFQVLLRTSPLLRPFSITRIDLPHLPVISSRASSGASSPMSLNRNHDIFNYTSGRWLHNERARLGERQLFFDVAELCRITAAAVDQSVSDIETFFKVAEGGSYRVIEVIFRDRLSVIARLPYPSTKPASLGISSEVATMDLLRRHGVPVPKVYAWSSTSSNSVGAEYMIMEKVQGIELQNIWYSMDVEQRMNVVGKIVDLEKSLFDLSLPANGSIYYKDNPVFKTGTVDIASDKAPNTFCIGPSTEYIWSYQKRDQLAINNGPWRSSAELLKAVGVRELAWLQTFGEPCVPEQPFYREFYDYQKVDPELQVKNLMDYLKLTSYLVPDGEELNRPTLRHPDLSPNNIFVSEAGEITGVIDWQHAVSLPFFLQAKMPDHFQNYGDEESETFQPPKLPDNLEEMTDVEKEREFEIYRRRQVHFFYLGFSSRCNPLHFDAMSSSSIILRNKLYESAGRPWEGDSISLKANLIQCATRWAEISTKLSSDCVNCPLSYSVDEIGKCLELDAKQIAADSRYQRLRDFVGVNIDGWVPLEEYEDAVHRAAAVKSQMMEAAETEIERREIEEHWPFDAHDETG